MKISLKHFSFLSVILSLLILLFLSLSQVFLWVLNKNLQNQYYILKHHIQQNSVNPHIIVAELDDESFEKIGAFPLDRQLYAQALENISLYNPAVVAFDILFLDPSNALSDTTLKEVFEKYPNVVLGASLNSTEKKLYVPIFTRPKFGFLSPTIFSGNNMVYSFSPTFQDAQGKIYEHFALAILRNFYQSFYQNDISQEVWDYTHRQYILSQDIHYPLSQKNTQEILIDFQLPEKFQRLSFSDLLDAKKLEETAKYIDFKDSIILIGPAAEGLKDEFFTPLWVQYGVYIHANILNTLLGKNFMVLFDIFQEWILIFCIVVLSVWINLSYHGKKLVLWNAAIILIFWGIIPISILLGTNLVLNYPVQIIVSLLLSIAAANAVKYLIESTHKKRLNQALSDYVGRNIAQEILLEEWKLNLDGEEKNLAYFFSDIEGFTTLSEKLTPAELIWFLRTYLTEMTQCIMQAGWHVDKFEGDAVMAFWGAFSPLESEDCIKLCESALLQQSRLAELNTRWKELFWTELHVRMWLHAGSAIVGNIGALGQKMEFPALWDNVNLASRLEGVNKFYGTYICASEKVYQATKQQYFYRFLDEIQVVWKEKSVKIYELLGKKVEIPQELQDRVEQFEQAWKLYAAQKFSEAKALFQSLQEAGDIPSQTYITRCDLFLKNPPESSWNGVWRMMEK